MHQSDNVPMIFQKHIIDRTKDLTRVSEGKKIATNVELVVKQVSLMKDTETAHSLLPSDNGDPNEAVAMSGGLPAKIIVQ